MEIWKDIVGYEGFYQVSNLGNVKSLARPDSGPCTKLEDKLLKQEVITRNHTTYRRVTLSVNGDVKRFQVHRLVAMEFIPNPDNKPQVNHIDGNGANNCSNNLEWVTGKENMQHSARLGNQDRPKALGTEAAAARNDAIVLCKLKRLLGERYIRSYFIYRNRYVEYHCTMCAYTHLEQARAVLGRGGPIIRRTKQCKEREEDIV